ncbi:hypothetical protein H6P81_009582 [Aristolochia fimbriata]|uniref:Polygalacturonase n=1 Tax=Aristolochia fimbriata TaxID=158543 RepID=A0AAV7ELB0_ARIFI|nr:hypothetical protein H6P81_009582 [Aristolochia fimbriata]
MEIQAFVLIIFGLLVLDLGGICRSAAGQATVFDVTTYGAVGDGKTDDSPAFVKAWSAACTTSGASTLLIPSQKTFLLSPLNFDGKCLASSIQIQLDGNLVAPGSREAFRSETRWILIAHANYLTITGSGQLDGQGAVWWPQNCAQATTPQLLTLESCNNVKLTGVWKMVNSPRNHLKINKCNNVSDDCISILDGISDVNMTSVYCGPGHGISIGSLGKDGSEAMVSEINVENCTFEKTQNGVRIKTWQGGSGYVKNIGFRHLEMNQVDRPIVIDQYYEDKTNKSSAVAVSEVEFVDIRGTASKEDAIQLACSLSVPCRNIRLTQISLTTPGKTAGAYCLNAEGPPCPDCTPPISIPC